MVQWSPKPSGEASLQRTFGHRPKPKWGDDQRQKALAHLKLSAQRRWDRLSFPKVSLLEPVHLAQDREGLAPEREVVHEVPGEALHLLAREGVEVQQLL